MEKDQDPIALHSQELLSALRRRQEFYENLPPERRDAALQFQNELEEKLAKVGNPHNRLVILQELMNEKLLEMREHLLNLKEHARKLQSTCASNDGNRDANTLP